MHTKSGLRIAMVAALVMVVCGVLVSGIYARAGSDNGACSNQTLKGDYGFAIEGLILAAPGVTLPLRGVAMTHFDGKGHRARWTTSWPMASRQPRSGHSAAARITSIPIAPGQRRSISPGVHFLP